MAQNPADDAPPPIPRPVAETIILGPHQETFAIIEGAIWPRVGSVFELGNPNRDMLVRDVRLRLHPSHASIVVRLQDMGDETIISPPARD
jgi:hypothetical protein